MAIDTAEKRQNVMSVARPWARSKFPIAVPDEEWRASTAHSYGGNALTPLAGVYTPFHQPRRTFRNSMLVR